MNIWIYEEVSMVPYVFYYRPNMKKAKIFKYKEVSARFF